MTQSKKTTFGLILVAWTLAVVFWPRSAEKNVAPTVEKVPRARLFEAPLTSGNFGVLGFNLYETKLGKKYWNVKSKFAEFFRRENYTFLKEVDAQFYSQNSDEVVNSRGDIGRSLTNDEVVELEGNVSVRTGRGYEFFLEKLIYDGKLHRFRSRHLVKMRGTADSPGSIFLEGEGLLGQIDDEVYFLRKNVTGKKRLSNDEWLNITSDSGKFYLRKKRASFRGNVSSQLPKVAIQSQKLDISVVKDREVLVATGQVRLKHNGKRGVAKRAVLDIGSDLVVLQGSARVVSKKDELTGDKILLFLDEDRVEVRGAQGQVERET